LCIANAIETGIRKLCLPSEERSLFSRQTSLFDDNGGVGNGFFLPSLALSVFPISAKALFLFFSDNNKNRGMPFLRKHRSKGRKLSDNVKCRTEKMSHTLQFSIRAVFPAQIVFS
jgi:hypothetical protein